MIQIHSREGKPDLVANHGQTIAHFPSTSLKSRQKGQGVTWQMGDGARIALETGITVATRFRDGDLAAGGEGAPLAPAFHRLVAESLGAQTIQRGISIHNLGGISNLTYFGPKGECFAFDTGPANLWIDSACQILTGGKARYDRGGKLASQQSPNLETVELLLKHPYFKKPIPKSTGRDEFPVDLFLEALRKTTRPGFKFQKDPSIVATATLLTVRSISEAYQNFILNRRLPLKQILLCGGGAKNQALLLGLQKSLPGVSIQDISSVGQEQGLGFKLKLDSQYIEAQAFAYLGYLSLFGEPVGGKWTGAISFGPPGHLIPGKNWKDLIKKIVHFT
jgi:anhydro-N-acetylmuramic acid kinase